MKKNRPGIKPIYRLVIVLLLAGYNSTTQGNPWTQKLN